MPTMEKNQQQQQQQQKIEIADFFIPQFHILHRCKVCVCVVFCSLVKKSKNTDTWYTCKLLNGGFKMNIKQI